MKNLRKKIKKWVNPRIENDVLKWDQVKQDSPKKEDLLNFCDQCRPKFVKLIKIGLETIQQDPDINKHYYCCHQEGKCYAEQPKGSNCGECGKLNGEHNNSCSWYEPKEPALEVPDSLLIGATRVGNKKPTFYPTWFETNKKINEIITYLKAKQGEHD